MPNLSKLSKDQWEDILESVDKTQIPVDCIKKITIKLVNRKQKTINISSLIKQGMETDEIEQFLARTMEKYSEDVKTLDFYVDIDRVASKVQMTTDQLIGHL